jgi:hypothetical protein
MTTRLRRSAVKALLIHITYVALLGHFLLLALGALDALVAARLGLPRHHRRAPRPGRDSQME